MDDLLDIEVGGAGKSSGSLFAALPKVGGTGAALLSSVPKPGAGAASSGKKVVQLVRSIDPKLLYDSDDEDERPAKKARTAAGPGSDLSSLLPAPQGQYTSGNKRVAQLEVGGEDERTRGAPASTSGSAAPAAAPHYASNEMYRVDDAGAYAAAYQYYGDAPGPAAPALAPSGSLELAGLDAELADRLAREARRNKGVGPVFTEISADAIRYTAPGRAEVNDAIKIAYGENYEAKIRAEAGPDPGKRAKSKHQISSLYHQAKLAEVEMAEQRAQSMKTVKETRSKYGWR